jgi:arylsulfatase A-like enzyme
MPERKQDLMKNLKLVMAELDRQIGRLMGGIKQLGIDDRTLVVFTSDNGPYPKRGTRTNGLRGSKLSLYEGGIRLPFIARWPGVVPAGATDSKTVIAAVDMFPTLCRLANVDLPGGVAFDGVDRSAALKGESQPDRERPLMWEYGRNEEFFPYPEQRHDRSPPLAIRDGRWKLLVNADGQGAELYDLATGTDETKNVAAEHPDIASRLQKAVLAWRRSVQ